MSGLNPPNIGHPVKSQLSVFRTRCDSVGHGTIMCSLVPFTIRTKLQQQC